MVELESLSLLGVLRWPVFWVGRQDNTKRPSWFLAKNPRGRSGSLSCGTGGGPHGQSQMINLVNGVVSPPCGHGRHQCEGRRMRNQAPGTGSKNTSGRPVYRFPSGSPLNSPKRLERGKRECLFRARVRQQAIGVLLISWKRKVLKCWGSRHSSLSSHCPASEAVGVLTRRCSAYEGCQPFVRLS